jgi:hypothetical protein
VIISAIILTASIATSACNISDGVEVGEFVWREVIKKSDEREFLINKSIQISDKLHDNTRIVVVDQKKGRRKKGVVSLIDANAFLIPGRRIYAIYRARENYIRIEDWDLKSNRRSMVAFCNENRALPL